jgi:hypothetical protein
LTISPSKRDKCGLSPFLIAISYCLHLRSLNIAISGWLTRSHSADTGTMRTAVESWCSSSQTYGISNPDWLSLWLWQEDLTHTTICPRRRADKDIYSRQFKLFCKSSNL